LPAGVQLSIDGGEVLDAMAGARCALHPRTAMRVRNVGKVIFSYVSFGGLWTKRPDGFSNWCLPPARIVNE
jgi:hypothetical protein